MVKKLLTHSLTHWLQAGKAAAAAANHPVLFIRRD